MSNYITNLYHRCREWRYFHNNFKRELRRHKTNKTVIIIGDSHVNFFSGNEELSYIPIGKDIRVCPQVNRRSFTAIHLGPGLAYNCMNEESSVETIQKTRFLMDRFISEGSSVVAVFGEIDIRVHILKQADKNAISCQAVTDDVIAEYGKYLLFLKEHYPKVYAWGPIASQSDLAPVDKNYPRIGSMIERNRVTRYFNEKLREFCDSNGIVYISIYDKLMDNELNTLDEYYCSDHIHLGQNAMRLAGAQLDEIK